jgi:hypothetical protein
MSVDGDSSGKAKSQICGQGQASSLSGASQIGGIKRKKRTFRELERWDIHNGESKKSSNHFNLSARGENQIASELHSQSNRRNRKSRDADSQSIKTLKFNSQLL